MFEVDPQERTVKCPYCGSRHLINIGRLAPPVVPVIDEPIREPSSLKTEPILEVLETEPVVGQPELESPVSDIAPLYVDVVESTAPTVEAEPEPTEPKPKKKKAKAKTKKTEDS
jgi:hypothetical protein